MIKETPKGIEIDIHVIPKSSQSHIIGWVNEELKVKIAALPDRGEANDELIRILAKTLRVSKSQVKIMQGFTSRHKRICISSATLAEIKKYLP